MRSSAGAGSDTAGIARSNRVTTGSDLKLPQAVSMATPNAAIHTAAGNVPHERGEATELLMFAYPYTTSLPAGPDSVVMSRPPPVADVVYYEFQVKDADSSPASRGLQSARTLAPGA